jgi:DNA-directed RNA polymerase subunit RPC12/RpoP
MKLLNKTQTEKLTNLLGYYKYFYICNTCGSVYGSDHLDSSYECVTCESARELEKATKLKRKKK